MVNMLIGQKKGMTQFFKEDGTVVPVTVLSIGPCWVVQKKTPEKDGYVAVQIGYQEVKEKKLNKPLIGHLKKYNAKPLRVIKECRLKDISEYAELNEGEIIPLEKVFKIGDKIQVTGISKGKGFQGVVKRWKFAGGPKTHGSMFHRAPGSIGASATPSRVIKGKKLPGRMGNRKTTIRNLEIVAMNTEDNILLVKGSVPGKRNSIVYLYKK